MDPDSNLVVRTKRPVVNDGEVEVRVEAIGLNFRDVLNVAKLHSMLHDGPHKDPQLLHEASTDLHSQISSQVMGMYPGDPGDPGVSHAQFAASKDVSSSFTCRDGVRDMSLCNRAGSQAEKIQAGAWQAWIAVELSGA